MEEGREGGRRREERRTGLLRAILGVVEILREEGDRPNADEGRGDRLWAAARRAVDEARASPQFPIRRTD